MTIQQILETFRITQQELADFTGIPRDRIGKWVQQSKQPPKAVDLKKIEVAVNYFTGKPVSELRSLIKEFQIVNDVVVARASGLSTKNKNKSGNPLDLPGIDDLILNSGDTKSNLPMISRILSIMEMQNANLEKVALAAEKTADANQTLARTVENLSKLMDNTGEKPAKRKAS